ncbi:MAG: TlpA disulfide reductase family protein [Psychroserpens sp.]|uniref:TlpA family protein disulfide reductase n=1 Tax=Psychroserpens sp. TaxID=2020870 RepID=UPI003C72EF27
MKPTLVLFALIPTLLFSQQRISGVFTPADEFTYAFLYHSTPMSSDYVDRAQIAEDGSFAITLDSTATPGIYKIVYALPPEEHNFDFIYSGKESVAFSYSLDEGLDFNEGQNNILWESYTKSMEMVNRTISNFYTQQSTDKKAFADIIKTLSETQNAYEESSKGTMASVFIKANKPYIPKGFEDLSTYSKNLKRTYLKHVDFSDPLLQSSEFLVDRVLAYVFGMNANTTDETFMKDVDALMVKMGEGQEVIKTSLFELIWRRFKNMENTELANYLSDTYLMALAKKTNYETLVEELNVYKNNAIGNKATNFDISILKDGEPQTTTLYDLNSANQYLVIFWSSSCSHCLDELPKVHSVLKDKKDIKVIAFAIEDAPENWQGKIDEFSDFIHVLGLEKWDNPIANQYGVQSTPSYFLLDKNKVIIDKPYDFEALEILLKK